MFLPAGPPPPPKGRLLIRCTRAPSDFPDQQHTPLRRWHLHHRQPRACHIRTRQCQDGGVRQHRHGTTPDMPRTVDRCDAPVDRSQLSSLWRRSAGQRRLVACTLPRRLARWAEDATSLKGQPTQHESAVTQGGLQTHATSQSQGCLRHHTRQTREAAGGFTSLRARNRGLKLVRLTEICSVGWQKPPVKLRQQPCRHCGVPCLAPTCSIWVIRAAANMRPTTTLVHLVNLTVHSRRATEANQSAQLGKARHDTENMLCDISGSCTTPHPTCTMRRDTALAQASTPAFAPAAVDSPQKIQESLDISDGPDIDGGAGRHSYRTVTARHILRCRSRAAGDLPSLGAIPGGQPTDPCGTEHGHAPHLTSFIDTSLQPLVSQVSTQSYRQPSDDLKDLVRSETSACLLTTGMHQTRTQERSATGATTGHHTTRSAAQIHASSWASACTATCLTKPAVTLTTPASLQGSERLRRRTCWVMSDINVEGTDATRLRDIAMHLPIHPYTLPSLDMRRGQNRPWADKSASTWRRQGQRPGKRQQAEEQERTRTQRQDQNALLSAPATSRPRRLELTPLCKTEETTLDEDDATAPSRSSNGPGVIKPADSLSTPPGHAEDERPVLKVEPNTALQPDSSVGTAGDAVTSGQQHSVRTGLCGNQQLSREHSELG